MEKFPSKKKSCKVSILHKKFFMLSENLKFKINPMYEIYVFCLGLLKVAEALKVKGKNKEYYRISSPHTSVPDP
jgi:hypothetical protein